MKRWIVFLSCSVVIGIVSGGVEFQLIRSAFPLSATTGETLGSLLQVILVEVSCVLTVGISINVLLFLLSRIRSLNLRPGFTTGLFFSVMYGILVIFSAFSLPGFLPHVEMKTPSPSLSPTSPSILFIIVDTMRQDRLGCYGNPLIKTPAADLLSRRSVQFSQAVSQIPITAPSHASMFSGLYPFSHGSRYNGVPVRETVPLIAERLRDAGYNTAAVVSSAAVKSETTGLDRGFDYYEELFCPEWFNPDLARVMPVRLMGRLRPLFPPERRATATNRRAIPVLDHLLASSPFFFWLHYYDPHIPYSPPSPYDVMYDPDYPGTASADIATIISLHNGSNMLSERDLFHLSTLYDGEVSAADRAIEELFRTCLTSRFTATRSPLYIILAADHGESLTEHNYFFYHGERLYDPSLLVPLLISEPESDHQTIIKEDPVLLLDLAPTFCGITGLTKAAESPGSDLLNTAHQSPPDSEEFNSRDMPPISSSLTRNDVERTAIAENGMYFFLHGGLHDLHLNKKAFCLRTGQWKYIRDADGTEQLFDLTVDPAELSPLRTGELLSTFREKLAALRPLLTTSDAAPFSLSEQTRLELQALGYIHDTDPTH